MNKKLGNEKQIKSAYEIQIASGNEKGKNCLLINNDELEVLFNEDNALDIIWVKYCGKNISFLSKNGINNNCGSFAENFEGGFLYTCGLDNVSNCVKDKKVHGSLHYRKSERVNVTQDKDKIAVSGEIKITELFGENLFFIRNYEVYKDKIIINDVIKNKGFVSQNYVLLYHMNFGYPFLDEGLEINADVIKSIPLTEIARKRQKEQFKITAPIDGGEEDVYYNYLKQGKVSLFNKDLNIGCAIEYDVNNFPYLLQWKSMISGDYALGIEPSVTRFDEFNMRQLDKQEEKNYKITVSFYKSE